MLPRPRHERRHNNIVAPPGIESGGATACIRAESGLVLGVDGRIDLLDDLRLRGRHRQLLNTADGLQGLRLDIGRRARNRVKTGFRGSTYLRGTTYTGPTACWISPWLVEPSSRPVNPPRPREPTTTTSWS